MLLQRVKFHTIQIALGYPVATILPILFATLLLFAQDTPTPPQRIRVGGNVQASNLVKKVTPVYPPLAKQARMQGTVRFTVIINKEGSVENVQLVSGHPLLVPSALEAVKQWKYRPTLLNGNPVEVITQIDINFTLADDPAWVVNWGFLARFRSSGGDAQPDAQTQTRPVKLLSKGTLSGESVSEALRQVQFRPLTLDDQPFEPAVLFSPGQPGIAEIKASWLEMAKRILARRDGVKPNENIQGLVTLDVVVNRDGNIERVLNASGHPELVQEARRVVTDWRFRPVVINGEAYPVRTSIPFEF
jgi:TonB family protein